MRGLDTNVILRYVALDDPAQTVAARALLEEAEDAAERLHINVIVLCELAWVLRSAPYRQDRLAVVDVLTRILETPLFEVHARDLVRRAIEDFRHGPADFSDYLIGWINRDAGCDTTITFERKLRKAGGFTLLAAAGQS